MLINEFTGRNTQIMVFDHVVLIASKLKALNEALNAGRGYMTCSYAGAVFAEKLRCGSCHMHASLMKTFNAKVKDPKRRLCMSSSF